jgi:hypothetical protein
MTSVQTPVGILSFPNLFTPRPRAPGGEPVYQCSLLFDQAAQKDPAYQALRKAVAECIDQTWGPGKSQDRAFLATLKTPFRDTAEKKYKGYEMPGGKFISPWTKKRPGVIDARKNEITTPEDVWPGQGVRAMVSVFSYTTPRLGVSFGLDSIQVCRVDGERLDGRVDAKDAFSEYTGPGAAAVMADEDVPF